MCEKSRLFELIASLEVLVNSTNFEFNHKIVYSNQKKLQIDKTANEKFYGYIVAGYSLGQILSAPSFGYWSNKLKQIKVPLYVGLCLMLIGNVIYISLEFIPLPAKYVLFVARFITGVGSSNSCLLRTYASTGSTSKDRPRAVCFSFYQLDFDDPHFRLRMSHVDKPWGQLAALFFSSFSRLWATPDCDTSTWALIFTLRLLILLV